MLRNKWTGLARDMKGWARDIRLGELMKLIPDDEIVMIFDDDSWRPDYPEDRALWDGTAGDWWKEKSTVTDMPQMHVLWFQARETEDTVGPVIMIVCML